MKFEVEINGNGAIDIYNDKGLMVAYLSKKQVKEMVDNVELDPMDLEGTAVLWAEKNLR